MLDRGEKRMAGHNDMGLEDLRERLRGFDRAVDLLFPGRRFRLVLVGGGALVLLGYLDRSTTDLDVLAAPAQLTELMSEYDLSGQVSAYGDHFPYDFEDRLVPLDLGTAAVACFTASLEDLVVSKLCSARDSDASDVREPSVLDALDWDKLAVAAAGLKESAMDERRYTQFLHDYDMYVKEFGPCAG
jgi:hypothetical protein